jgi:hypothetical protein
VLRGLGAAVALRRQALCVLATSPAGLHQKENAKHPEPNHRCHDETRNKPPTIDPAFHI